MKICFFSSPEKKKFKGIYTHKCMQLFKWTCVVCKVITFMLSSPP